MRRSNETRCAFGAVMLVGLAVGLAPAAAPPRMLRAAQEARLKEGARLGAESARLWQAGKQAESLAAWQKKLAIDREVYGDTHEVVAGSLHVLARIHEARATFAPARKTREEVLAIRTRLDGAKHWRVTDARLDLEDLDLCARLGVDERQQLVRATALNGQVARLWQQGRSKEALPLAEEALALRGKLLGEKHRDYALSLFTLGAQHQALRQVRQAELCYLRARDILKEGLGEKHPDYATTLHHLAVLYRTMGDYARAEPLYRQARDTRKEALGEKHPATSTRPRWARSTASTPPACTTWPFSSSPESRP